MKIGVFGAGQLGRMLAQAGERLGMEFRFLDPATEISARGLGEHLCAAYEDVDALEQFVRGLDVVTYEFENVPCEPVRWVAERVPVHPAPEALRLAQDRLFEKNFFQKHGIPVPPYGAVFFKDEYRELLQTIGFPLVVKTRRYGYDGKGQRTVRNQEEAERAWKDLHGLPLLLEGHVPFERELSLLAVRGQGGECRFYPLVENHHRDGILRLSRAPAADVPAVLQSRAEEYARRLLEEVQYVGVLAIEFFQHGEELLANEMAPRVHNSGHWTIEGAETSQFENHLRAITGMELGSTAPKGTSAMVNLIGIKPDGRSSDGLPPAHWHDYGKSPRPGRKLGHVTLVREALEVLEEDLPSFLEIAETVL